MTNIWFTSDTHFGHANIINLCNRPFKISNWNDYVKPKDKIFHLGDFCFSRDPGRIYRRLNGEKFLVIGNHDRRKCLTGMFSWVKDAYKLKYNKKINIWLSHYPHRSWPGSNRGSYHLYGHSHGNAPDIGRSTDVGVDCWRYYPVNIDTIIKRLNKMDVTEHH